MEIRLPGFGDLEYEKPDKCLDLGTEDSISVAERIWLFITTKLA